MTEKKVTNKINKNIPKYGEKNVVVIFLARVPKKLKIFNSK